MSFIYLLVARSLVITSSEGYTLLTQPLFQLLTQAPFVSLETAALTHHSCILGKKRRAKATQPSASQVCLFSLGRGFLPPNLLFHLIFTSIWENVQKGRYVFLGTLLSYIIWEILCPGKDQKGVRKWGCSYISESISRARGMCSGS